jgi:hypothetical protein
MDDDKEAGNLGAGKAGRPRRGRRSQRSKVISIEAWCKDRVRAAEAAREKLSPEAIPSLCRAQKAAFLLKFILNDYTTDKELDELVLSAAQCSVAPRGKL